MADILNRGSLIIQHHPSHVPDCSRSWGTRTRRARPSLEGACTSGRGSHQHSRRGFHGDAERTTEGHLWAWEVFIQETMCKLNHPPTRGTAHGRVPSRGDSACLQSWPASKRSLLRMFVFTNKSARMLETSSLSESSHLFSRPKLWLTEKCTFS